MSRTVSLPPYLALVAYAQHSAEDSDAFSEDVENLAAALRHAFPSLRPCDKWLGREDHAILENHYAYVGVSEYCGLLAVWVSNAPDPCNRMGLHWAQQIARRFHRVVRGYFGHELHRVATFSNGEAVYERTDT